MKDVFNVNAADSQATVVHPIEPQHFDIDEYADYEASLLERCGKFWNSNSGVLVYRRMRVKEVFAADSNSKEKSLAWQLGALKESMRYQADIPNFLEPWHGLGTVAAAYGFDYVWEPGLAPAVDGKFQSTEELLKAPVRPVADTPIGKYTLEMTEYFLENTKGRIPMSYCDVQSPLNTLSNIIDSNQFYMDFYLNPELMKKAMHLTSLLLTGFTLKQKKMIGDALAKSGHGFASCRKFDGIGMSDDTITMMSADLYKEFAVPAMVATGNCFGGTVFHSCGNWSDKKELITKIENIRMADGAFSFATDPGANPTEGYADAFANTGVVLNARIVGNIDVVEEKVKQLWKPGMKLIVVTYCETPQEQAEVYQRIHDICQ